MQSISVQTLYDNGMFIPMNEKDRILTQYGTLTLMDFDKRGLNEAIGDIYPGAKLKNSYISIMTWMNNYECKVLYDKLGPKWSDMFNIVHSAIKSTKGEKVWYI